MSGRCDSDTRPTPSEMLRELVKVTIPEMEKKPKPTKPRKIGKKKRALRNKRTFWEVVDKRGIDGDSISYAAFSLLFFFTCKNRARALPVISLY